MALEVRIEGGLVYKKFATAEEADLLVARVASARAAGVATPNLWPTDVDGEVAMDRIHGESGRDALARRTASVRDLLSPVPALHAAPISGLRRFDPARRIRPRLRDESEAAVLTAGLTAIRAAGPGREVTLHGDLHVGQLISGADGFVLLDFDDLARGPAEADYGNFAAHLASAPEFQFARISDGLSHWLDQVLEVHPRLSRPRAEAYAHVALLRRGLKLRSRAGTHPVFSAAVELLSQG